MSANSKKKALFCLHPIKALLASSSLRYTNSLSGTASSLRVLTTDSQVPVVAKTTVSPDLSEAHQILTKNGGQIVGQHVLGLSSGKVLLSVEEPCGDLELGGLRHNVNNALELGGGQITSAEIVRSQRKTGKYRFLASTPAFFKIKEAKRRPTPLMAVRA
jgi:hypothetical protein